MFEEYDDAVDVFFLTSASLIALSMSVEKWRFLPRTLAREREMIVVIMTKEDVINHGEDKRGKQD